MENAEIILYPAGEENYKRFFDMDRHSPFRDKEYIYVAHDRITVLPLPFDPEKVEIWQVSK